MSISNWKQVRGNKIILTKTVELKFEPKIISHICNTYKRD